MTDVLTTEHIECAYRIAGQVMDKGSRFFKAARILTAENACLARRYVKSELGTLCSK